MEKLNGKMNTDKASEIGIKGKLPYSVETPYGFRLDLDFLKYVDDIEKGRTIKRISIQRHSKGPRVSTFPRHANPSGYTYRQSPWGSTGALSHRSRLSEEPHRGPASWFYEHRSHISRAEIEAKIREFDEQPLGEHIRPHLLRASSLPLTVLLRQGLEEPGILRSSKEHLEERNKSCEDIFDSMDSPNTQDCSGLLKRLRDALDHVEELEIEVRVIPDLRAQICLLKEENEKLRSHNQPLSKNRTFKSPQPEQCHNTVRDHAQEWRTSSDLDELLTVTSLQAKVALLEQKLHETKMDPNRLSGKIKHQKKEIKGKDEQIDNLVTNPGVWVHAERVVVDQQADESMTKSQCVGTNGEHTDSPEVSADTSVVIHHITRLKQLLEQQWECLSEVEKEKCAQNTSPKMISLQEEMMGLLNILTSYCTQPGHKQRHTNQRKGGECAMTTDTGVWISNAAAEGNIDCYNPAGDDSASQMACSSGQEESTNDPWKMAPTQVYTEQEKTTMEHKREVISEGNGWTDGGLAAVEAAEIAKTPIGKQMEEDSGYKRTTQSSETVNADFLSACLYLNEHMDNIEDPTNDTRKALMVLFQNWFSAAAEENSVASNVSAYLKEVKRATPSLLGFLINLADDNGNTALHYSVSNCNYSIVSLLLDTGVSDVNFQNKAGYTTVMLASLTAPDNPGHMEVVRRLMELGNINICSSQTGQTALHLAVRHGRVVMVRLLLSCGADANIQDGQGTTALMFASERGYTHIARLLLERTQCDLTRTDQSGRTALSIAKLNSHSDTATLLQAHARARAL
ncbi:KN motif and ankyrin repeat domain-containing protein 4-like [Stigmatopora nigra]